MKVYPMLTDNGDGGYGVTLYLTKKERDADRIERGWDGNEENDSDYDYGYISDPVTIKEGKEIHMHFGQ